jgi:hypothetical protein
MSREDFSATPVFNEWFRPAEFGLAILAVNLLVREQVSTLLCVANAPKNDHITGKQTLAFKAHPKHPQQRCFHYSFHIFYPQHYPLVCVAFGFSSKP